MTSREMAYRQVAVGIILLVRAEGMRHHGKKQLPKSKGGKGGIAAQLSSKRSRQSLGVKLVEQIGSGAWAAWW